MAQAKDETIVRRTLDGDEAQARETVAMLGARPASVPPLTCGRLPLLELIGSPLVKGGEITVADCIRALYVLRLGADAVSPVFRARRRQEALEKLRDRADASGEYASALVAAEQAAALELADFDAECARWIEAQGVCDLEAVADALRDELRVHMGGFGILPGVKEKEAEDGEPAQKKSTSLIPNGWRQFLRRLRKFIRA